VRIGAHLRTRREVGAVIETARSFGADAAQLFISSPRAWAGPVVSEEEGETFRSRWSESGLGPLFVHAPYLVNIASPNPEFVEKSRELLARTIRGCEVIGADGFVVHAGSGGPGERSEALERAAGILGELVPQAETTSVVVELMAGTAGAVASRFAEAAELFGRVGDERLRLCTDTCHLFAAGYDLSTPEGVTSAFDELRAEGLLDRLMLVHANDSEFPMGEHRDRHTNIGNGHIGVEGFHAILADPAVQGASAVLVETPGDVEAHRRDIGTLRELAPGGARAPAPPSDPPGRSSAPRARGPRGCGSRASPRNRARCAW
jgi:deoxyribonuclease-4